MMKLAFSENRLKDALLGIVPFFVAGLVLSSIEWQSKLVMVLLFWIFLATAIAVSVYALRHEVPMWTLPWIGFVFAIPFPLFFLLIVIIPVFSYRIARQNSRVWLLFLLPFAVLWAFLMCDEMHPSAIRFVQTTVILFCVLSVFSLILTRLKSYYPVLLTGIALYTALNVYIIFYAPFDPQGSLSLTCKNSYIGVLPTLLGYLIPGLIVVSGPAYAYLRRHKDRRILTEEQ